MRRGEEHKPTKQSRKLVKALASYGIPQRDIIKLIDLGSATTLEKYYREELDTGELQATSEVAKRVFNEARNPNGNIAAAFFWLKTRGKGLWRETTVHEHQGKGGGPIQTVDVKDLEDFTDDELRVLERASRKLAGRSGADRS